MNPVAGKRILILEDEVLLALEAAETLQEIGAIIMGPAHRIQSAMQMLDGERPDAALLDVNINGAFSTEVAARLAALGVPFILATGYGAGHDVAGGWMAIDKPYNREQIQSAFRRVFDSVAAPQPSST